MDKGQTIANNSSRKRNGNISCWTTFGQFLESFAVVHISNTSEAAFGKTSIFRSSVRRFKIESSCTTKASLRNSFFHSVDDNGGSLALHWHGELLPDLTRKENLTHVDRLPILVFSPDIEYEKLLNVLKLKSSTEDIPLPDRPSGSFDRRI